MSYPAIVFTESAGDAWIEAMSRMAAWNVSLYPKPDTKLAETAANDGSIYVHLVGADRDDATGTPRLGFRRLVTHADSSETYSDTTEHISDEDLDRIEVH